MIINGLITKLLLKRYGWFGNYSSWDEARQASKGYDSRQILEKVKEAVLRVRNGEAEFERDSVLFYEREYSWPLLSALFLVASENNGKLRLLDFGGSLGSTYFQHKPLLKLLREVSWNIVEQEGFYEIGKRCIEDDVLQFHPDVHTCLENQPVDAVLLGCVLPYMEAPYLLLEKIFTYNVPYLLIDRTPFIDSEKDRLTVQKVPPAIYKGSYPAWFFSYRKFIDFVSSKYHLLGEYNCKDVANIRSSYKGLILKLIDENP